VCNIAKYTSSPYWVQFAAKPKAVHVCLRCKQISPPPPHTDIGPVAVLAAAKNDRFNIPALKSYVLVHTDVVISIHQK
jgi:hypothetical protein